MRELIHLEIDCQHLVISLFVGSEFEKMCDCDCCPIEANSDGVAKKWCK